jgi:hypothetical protein
MEQKEQQKEPSAVQEANDTRIINPVVTAKVECKGIGITLSSFNSQQGSDRAYSNVLKLTSLKLTSNSSDQDKTFDNTIVNDKIETKQDS